jgi:DNA-binding PadR family transcriptional regulator
MSIKYAILGLLARKPAHGYELKKSFEGIAGPHWALNVGQVYTTLSRLEAEGLVEPEEGPRAGTRDRQTYCVTPEGLDALGEWVREPVGRTPPVRDELQVKLLFADRRRPQLILGLVDEQRRVYRHRLEQARARAGGGGGRRGLPVGPPRPGRAPVSGRGRRGPG